MFLQAGSAGLYSSIFGGLIVLGFAILVVIQKLLLNIYEKQNIETDRN